MNLSHRIVLRENSILRYWSDYRKFNAETTRKTYSIPRMNEFMDLLKDTTIFLALDAKNGYSWVEFDDDQESTVMTWSYGLLQFISMQFGFKRP